MKRIPRAIWTLGFVSLFMDISSEMVHALLPVFLVSVVGASMVTLGLIEGTAEAIASVSKLFSGWLSDRLRRRKALIVAGYGLAGLAKPIFALAGTVAWVMTGRFLDRLGKGIRGAPRDAMVADIAPPELRGASFGLRQSLDTVGAFLGPLLAIALMAATDNSIRSVFWLAAIPAALAMAILVIGVKEPEHPGSETGGLPIRFADLARLHGQYWAGVGIGTALMLARFSEAFLILRARDVGLTLALVPGILVVMNVAYSLAAYPAGALSDRIGRASVLGFGIALLVVADILLALGQTIELVLLGVFVWGLHMGFTQGLLATLVADSAPADLRGTAFGVFNLLGGITVVLASAMAGLLWDRHGPSAAFFASAGFAALALLGIVVYRAGLRRASVRLAERP